MIKKFEDFLNEGLFQNIKRKFNPTTDDNIETLTKINDNILQSYKILFRFQDDDTFCEYLQYCEDALNLLNKLVIDNNKLKVDNPIKNIDFIKIQKIAKITLTIILETFPKELKAESTPEWFVKRLQNVIKMHITLADLYNVDTIKVSKFKRI